MTSPSVYRVVLRYNNPNPVPYVGEVTIFPYGAAGVVQPPQERGERRPTPFFSGGPVGLSTSQQQSTYKVGIGLEPATPLAQKRLFLSAALCALGNEFE